MKSSAINKFINEESIDLKGLISDKVLEYQNLMKKRGSTIPLHFLEDEEINLNKHALKILLESVLAGKLSNVDLAYICDCLTLGEEVEYENEEVKDTVFEIADPEINGFKSGTEIKKVLESLR